MNEAIANEQASLNELYNELASAMNETNGGNTPEEPEMPESWDKDKVYPEESEDGVIVPVPKGYTASSVSSENTVSEGFVIYENTNGQEGKEEINEGNVDNARENRNQFVWVPVANPSEMYGTDSSGKKWGKLYSFSADRITARNWIEQEGVMTITDTTQYREPDVVENDSSNSVTKGQLETEFNAMIASVERYGGFYIGRYETGNLSKAKVVVVKDNSDIDNQTWYTMYNKAKEISASNKVTTTMIWGCQWDAVMRWMYNSGNAEKKKYTYDSTGKGNYEAFPIATGSVEEYAVNNIYDMAGNVYDWTIEEGYTSYRVCRGGVIRRRWQLHSSFFSRLLHFSDGQWRWRWFSTSFIYVALCHKVKTRDCTK